jgi:MFS family permease
MTTLTAAPSALPLDPSLPSLLQRIALRYLPLLFLAYIVAILDRVNVGFAKLAMQQALQFSDVVYGVGAGVFFIGYFLFEVPSNMLLARIGARKWIARILILWGPIAAATAFVQTPAQFYVLRFLLGVGEAGLFPGVVLLLTYWFPAERRTRYIAMFMLGIPIAGMIVGPLSASIISGMQGLAGLAGWQWMFVVQGLPALLLGFSVLLWLDDRPASARWLSAAEKTQLQRAVGEVAVQPLPWRQELRVAVTHPGIWLPTIGYFFFVGAANIFGLWGPQFLQDILATDIKGIGATFAVIFLAGTIGMVCFGALADRGRRETLLLALMVGGGVAFLVAAMNTGQAAVATVALGIGVVAYLACFPVFWGSVTSRLAPAAAAAAIALINAMGNLGGAVGPALIGPIKQSLGLGTSIATLGIFMLIAAVLLSSLKRR